MEKKAQRRLLSISRHLLPSQTTTADLLHPSPVSAATGCSSSLGPCPVIIGGMVLDILAKPYTHTKPGTTTPGKEEKENLAKSSMIPAIYTIGMMAVEVQYVRGGVARNIAECMAKLGVKPFMISVIGNDMAGDLLLEHLKSLGLATEGIMKSQTFTTPVVSNIFDVNGELAVAVASVEAVEKCLTQDWIERFRCNICSAPVLMVDANLHPQSLEFACQIATECNVPVWFEPVSLMKSKRVISIFKYITCISPNEAELIAMANTLSSADAPYSYQNVEKNGERRPVETSLLLLKPAIRILLDKGIKLVVVTLGSDGVLLCSKEDPKFIIDSWMSTGSDHSKRELYKLVNSNSSSSLFLSSDMSGDGNSSSYALHFPALPASVVSVTGAGDCLVGGVLASICSGLDIVQGMAVAVSTAKAAVETEANVPSQYHVSKIADEARKICAAVKVFNIT